METTETGRDWTDGLRRAIAQIRTRSSEVVGQAPGVAGTARDRGEQVARHLPEAFDRVRSSAGNGVTRLQTMPDSGLRLLAAASIGLGTGLRLAGKSRLATLAGFVPASILGFAIVSRPNHQAPHPVRP